MNDKSMLLIISSDPYKESDAAWNALRLAKTAREGDVTVKVFLINEGVDTGRKGVKPPESSFDLSEMLKEVKSEGVEVKYCKTCIDRCGVGEGEMIDEIEPGSMPILSEWIMSSDKVVTF
ncbi:hypothetical protein MNBD_NITROSPINAE03-1084 [hydrothermal vent metagenome]|uniref:Uncharacterized protein n=1 Tax=hydrothermal vent metagenome TaxID=652676 RepID=A0A3B1BJI5_9ZZZZ